MPAPAPHVEVVDDEAHVRREWGVLAERSGNLFAGPEWCATWREQLAPDAAPRMLACRDSDGRLRALWPLYEHARGPVRVLRLLGHGVAQELGPACAPADRELAASGLRSALARDLFGARLLVAERMSAAAGWAAALRGRGIAGGSRPVVPIAGRSWEDFVAERHEGSAAHLERRRSVLERAHDVEYHRTRARGELGGDFDDLERLVDGGAFAGARGRFHRAFAELALEHGWLRLWVLRLDGRPVAASYGFRFASIETGYASGFDAGWEPWAVGAVLFLATLRDAFADGLREYRLPRDGASPGARWTDRTREVESVVVAPGPFGSAVARLTTRAPAD